MNAAEKRVRADAWIETGKRIGEVTLYRRLAQRLAVRIEDLLAEEG